MLPKKHRLSKTADVNLTTAKGRGFFSKSYIVKFLSNSEITVPQMTVVVSTKVSKSAVIRNRLKRIVRQVVHESIDTIKPGFYVFILKKTAVPVDSEALRDELISGFKKSKMII